MYKLIVLTIFLVATTLAQEYEIVNSDGEDYVLVPLNRVRRQTSIRVDPSGRSTLSHTGTIVDNNRHQLLGTGFASKQFKPNGPLTTGGSLDYMHKPSGSNLNVGASNTRGYGTDLSAAGRYNFVNNPRTNVFAEGRYDRHYGGPFGTGRPNWGVGVGVQHRF